MPLQRITLNEALKRFHLKISSINILERCKFESPSPTSTLNFDNEEDIVPRDIPKGFFAMYVGKELKRYVIPVMYLKHHVFEALLNQAEEEYGYCSNGAIRLPCDTVFFDRLLWLLDREDPSVKRLEGEELLNFYQ